MPCYKGDAYTYLELVKGVIKCKKTLLNASEAITHSFYQTLGAGEHGTHNGEVLCVGYASLPHVFEHLFCGGCAIGILGIKPDVGVDASCEDTKCASQNKSCKRQTDETNLGWIRAACSPQAPAQLGVCCLSTEQHERTALEPTRPVSDAAGAAACDSPVTARAALRARWESRTTFENIF